METTNARYRYKLSITVTKDFLSRYTFPAKAEILLANLFGLSLNIGVNLNHGKYTSDTGNCCS